MPFTTLSPPGSVDGSAELENDEQEALSSQEGNNGPQTEVNEPIPYQDDRKKGASSDAANGCRFPDPIHKKCRLPSYCLDIINTPHFNRLKELRQLGVANHVFPCAEHTRRSHSLGVAYLAYRLLKRLMKRQPELKLMVEPRDIRNVVLAGLCHDLGHGPLSHTFEKEFLRRVGGMTTWKHEDMSIMMLKDLLQTKGITDVGPEDITFIEELIKGVDPKQRAHIAPGKRFLFDIISNDFNGIDVDRMDYLQRDARMCGHTLHCDIEALIKSAKVLNDQICFPSSQRDNVWGVFRERLRLFREVYTHRRTKVVEIMVAEALAEADQTMNYSAKIHCVKDFLGLDDTLLREIQRDQRPSLSGARKILARLECDDLYAFCGECEVPECMLLGGTWEGEAGKRQEFTAAQVVACQEGAGGLTADDLILDENRLEYAKGGGNPLAAVGFFQDEEMPAPELEQPKCFKIRALRVFVRQADHADAAALAFSRWCRVHLEAEATLEPTVPGDPGSGSQRAGAGAPLGTAAQPSSGSTAVPASSPHPATPAAPQLAADVATLVAEEAQRMKRARHDNNFTCAL